MVCNDTVSSFVFGKYCEISDTNFSARSEVLLCKITRNAPASAKPASNARAEPPEPRMAIVLFFGEKFNVFSERINPEKSVFVPVRCPLTFLIVLTAPIFLAIGVTSSRYGMTELL